MGLDFDFSRLDAQDVLDLAIFVEEEAKESYEQLVAWMKNQGNDEASEFFGRMARLEELHGRQIADLRHSMFGDVPPRHTRNIAWEVETPDFQAMGRDVSLQDALLFALGAETRAWDYYNGALEYIHEPEVIRLLEGLRDAEKEHQRLLEREMAKNP
jgi:rubrerythrin